MADPLATLTARFDAAAESLRAVLATLGDDDWSRVCEPEGWTIALETLHVALGYRRQLGFLDDAFVRSSPAVFDWGETDRLNGEIAARRRPHPPFVLRFLDQETRKMQDRLAAFTPADLTRETILYEGRMLTLDQFIRGFLIGHTTGHTESIRAGLARP